MATECRQKDKHTYTYYILQTDPIYIRDSCINIISVSKLSREHNKMRLTKMGQQLQGL